MTPEQLKAVDLYRKLMAKASGTESEEEAMAFMEGAQKILAKHNLSASDAVKQEKPEIGQRIHKSVDTNQWRLQLFGAVAEMYFCTMYITQTYEGALRRKYPVFIGKEHNSEIALSMATYLEKTVLRLAKDYSSYRKDRLQFEKGCGMRIAGRIRQMTKELRRPKGDGSGLPSLYGNELKLAEAFLDAMKLPEGKAPRGWTQTLATLAGHEAGNKVHLGGQLPNGSAGHLLG